MRKLILTVLVSLIPALSFGFSLFKEDPVRTTLRVNQYNSVAEQYMERPTSVIVRGKPGKQELMVSYTPYGGVSSPGGDYALFSVKNSDAYISHISKFLEWAEKASANGDAFDKEIGAAPSIAGMKFKFSFHSGNSKSHYLVLTVCVLGNCSSGESLYFDVEGAKELMSLINKLKAGELPGENVGDKYN